MTSAGLGPPSGSYSGMSLPEVRGRLQSSAGRDDSGQSRARQKAAVRREVRYIRHGRLPGVGTFRRRTRWMRLGARRTGGVETCHVKAALSIPMLRGECPQCAGRSRVIPARGADPHRRLNCHPLLVRAVLARFTDLGEANRSRRTSSAGFRLEDGEAPRFLPNATRQQRSIAKN